MIVEIAIATQTAPRDWYDESDEILATAIDVLAEMAARTKRMK
jgi:hypothetical protein